MNAKNCHKDSIAIHAAEAVHERTKANQIAKAGCLPRGMSDYQTIVDFEHPSAALSFRLLNDTTMGGGSGCELKYFNVEKYSRFFGRLSYVRGGGFASVRSPLIDRGELTGTHGIVLLSQSSDMQLYKVMVTTVQGEGCSASLWVADFFPSGDADGLWRVTKLPYEQFTPIHKNQPWNPGGDKARSVLNPSLIETVGIAITRWRQDGTDNPHCKEGTFTMNIKNIRAYFSSLSVMTSPVLRDASPQRSPLLTECMSYLDPPVVVDDAASEPESAQDDDLMLAPIIRP